MPYHQQSLDVDALDDYDGGYDSADEAGEELSPEDKIQMQECTEKVQEVLGPSSDKVTVQQIQDTLWHYYYDIDKSVTYLLDKYVSPRSKTPKQSPEGACLGYSRAPEKQTSFAGFFSEMPWLNIPKARQAIFIEPWRPKGGLLGGSGQPPKMSKLQALAAARKKRAEERQSEDKPQATSARPMNLSIRGGAAERSENGLLPDGSAKRRKLDEDPAAASLTDSSASQLQPDYDEQQQDIGAPMNLDGAVDLATSSAEQPRRIELSLATPSVFAQTLFESHTKRHDSEQHDLFPLPYLALAPSCLQDAFSGPSPDDIVLAAQSKAGKNKSTTATSTQKKKGGKSAGVDDATNGVKGLKVADSPLPKSKNLNVLEEFAKSNSKRAASFVVVGHVDAGKSTLMGRLLLDLKVVDPRTIERYRKEAEGMGKSSFALAWVLDQGTEERSRGVTIDIATNHFETDSTSFTILDAPGHQDFIPNMIAGASQAEFAILVIDASVGAFESGLKGQTKEHSLLIRSMGVSRVIVAVNKLDAIGWSEDRFVEIKQQMSGFLSVTGFQLKNIAFVPVAGLLGNNIIQRSEDKAASWYTGPTLVEELEKWEPQTRALQKPLRLTISEVFKTGQSPLTISGRIESGSLQMGDAILLQPSGEKAYIKSLEVDMEPTNWAVAGQNVILHLMNIDASYVQVGAVICDPLKPVDCIDSFKMKVLAFDFLMPMKVDIHRGRLHCAGQIQEVTATLNKTTGAIIKKKPNLVKPGNVARIVVKMDSKVPLEKGQRVVLRSGGVTIAAGLLE